MALDPSDSGTRIMLREILLRQGLREEACVAWRQFIDGHAKAHDDWDGYAELCLFLGDVAEYHRGCRELLTRFGSSTDPQVCERTGRACLLLPETPHQMQRAAASDRSCPGRRQVAVSGVGDSVFPVCQGARRISPEQPPQCHRHPRRRSLPRDGPGPEDRPGDGAISER